ncbi:MAG: hypothetical protein ACHQU8_05920 [Gemmatimonadales bacterium]
MDRPGFMIRRRARRMLATAMLLHYAAATWILPGAHALFVDSRPEGTVHVESEGNHNCPPIHDHLNCTIFSDARLLAAPPRAVRLPDSDRVIAARRPLQLEGRPLPAATSSLGSRAPPLV